MVCAVQTRRKAALPGRKWYARHARTPIERDGGGGGGGGGGGVCVWGGGG